MIRENSTQHGSGRARALVRQVDRDPRARLDLCGFRVVSSYPPYTAPRLLVVKGPEKSHLRDIRPNRSRITMPDRKRRSICGPQGSLPIEREN